VEHQTDPLWPLVAAGRALGTFVIVIVLLAGAAAVFGSGSVLTLGKDDVCAEAQAGNDIPMGGVDARTEAAQNRLLGLAPGVSRIERTESLCQEHPTAADRALAFLTAAPEFGLLMGFLGGVRWLVGRARRHGLFSRAVAGAVHGLGWWVLAGWLVVATVQALATSLLLSRMVPDHPALDLGQWHTSVTALLAGAGLLTIARVMRIAVDMRTELDATI
jgi:DUF2975 family protein